ncbi:c-type cytochrome biogenesis protein CcmI [Marinomonas algarum]|uniref:C-type cytochrome biogenesis protein CcmI n=1 Tax=Marinomonas algarum TaxID=2883105 RepID=A0A9X1IQ21_9GAMM|nr:c-type cytochrome biogenesis protein CcmI [Marinomonas algarum]MCB5162001.1 c-type cytochrome biogenesis protein CcmI [Marinomonas algarum]
MMIMYLAMIALLMLSVVWLYWSLAARSAKNTDEDRFTFVSVRQREIAEEKQVGRLSAEEAAQLLKDTKEESLAVASHQSRRLMTDTRLARQVVLLAIVVTILGSVTLYQFMGYSRDVAFTEDLQKQRLTPDKITHFLQYRSERYGRTEDWYYLASDYMNTGRYSEAVVTFEKALEVMPDNTEGQANLMAEYAQAVFYANDNQSSDKMRDIVEAALALEPTQVTALDLKGVAEFARQNYLGAVLAWQEAIRYSVRSGERLALLSAIGKARQRGFIDYQQVAPIITDQLAVKIEWDTGKVTWQADDVLLVYASVKDQAMPVAIQRVTPEELGQLILLTNLDSLMPTATLAEIDKVDVTVKLASLHDNDLTKGRIIGRKQGLSVNQQEIFSINVAL